MGASNKTLDDTLTTGTGAKVRRGGVSGATISAGQAVRFDSATQRYKLASGASATDADAVGFARQSAKDGQPLEVIEEGTINGLTGIVVGKVYVLSDDSPGDVMEVDDLAASGDYVTVVGIGITATSLKVGIVTSGVEADAVT